MPRRSLVAEQPCLSSCLVVTCLLVRLLQSQMLIFDNEQLSLRPETVMPRVWDFLGVPPLEKNFTRGELHEV